MSSAGSSKSLYEERFVELLEKHMDPDQPGGPWSFYSFGAIAKVSSNTLCNWLKEFPAFRAVKEKQEARLNKKR